MPVLPSTAMVPRAGGLEFLGLQDDIGQLVDLESDLKIEAALCVL